MKSTQFVSEAKISLSLLEEILDSEDDIKLLEEHKSILETCRDQLTTLINGKTNGDEYNPKWFNNNHSFYSTVAKIISITEEREEVGYLIKMITDERDVFRGVSSLMRVISEYREKEGFRKSHNPDLKKLEKELAILSISYLLGTINEKDKLSEIPIIWEGKDTIVTVNNKLKNTKQFDSILKHLGYKEVTNCEKLKPFKESLSKTYLYMKCLESIKKEKD